MFNYIIFKATKIPNHTLPVLRSRFWRLSSIFQGSRHASKFEKHLTIILPTLYPFEQATSSSSSPLKQHFKLQLTETEPRVLNPSMVVWCRRKERDGENDDEDERCAENWLWGVFIDWGRFAQLGELRGRVTISLGVKLKV